jgi:hypothetical protein
VFQIVFYGRIEEKRKQVMREIASGTHYNSARTC